MKQSPSELQSILAARASMPRRRLVLIIAVLAIIILVVLSLVIPRLRASAEPPPPFVTEPLTRGNISLTITATGNLEPTNQVTVGSELSGITLEVYVDTNDRVVKGQPLAKLDTSKLAQQTAASRASVISAKARVTEAEATLKETEADLARQQELHRLSGGKIPSQAGLASAVASAERARAALLSAQASVGEAEAQVLINESDLAKAVIKSPIDGIVLIRDIEPGQTVAANFTAPELFVIAENLEHMKLKVAIAEADIGRVAKGQSATFTVDAWPSRVYTASVLKVSFGSAITDNVVTYETELQIANTDLSLRPGMTATADIRVAESKHVFLVPSSALRFAPAVSSSPARAPAKKSFVQSLAPLPPRGDSGSANTAPFPKPAPGSARVWILRDGHPEAVPVTIGLADERHTEISGEALAEGLPVIIRAAPSSR
jgi:HlyD family secretion protein